MNRSCEKLQTDGYKTMDEFNVAESRRLGFEDVAEMKQLQSEGFNSKADALSDAKRLGFEDVDEMRRLVASGFKSKKEFEEKELQDKKAEEKRLTETQAQEAFKATIVECWWVNTSIKKYFNEAGMGRLNINDGPLGAINLRSDATARLILIKYVEKELPPNFNEIYDKVIISTNRRLFDFVSPNLSPSDFQRIMIRKFNSEMNACDKKLPL